ncbi:hypothetical protein [Rhodococcus rhodnii]|uniref:hypothetical protein n=1 Tax=Rhodococcus rhodnii TaxID=38312 RepID=UPI0003A2C2F6|nr:hypothetical protein [Rhodococcus rhodnii]
MALRDLALQDLAFRDLALHDPALHEPTPHETPAPRETPAQDALSDAVRALTVASERPARITPSGEVRVDFEFSRYVLAREVDHEESSAADAGRPWLVRVFRAVSGRTSDIELASATAPWLVDAFDAAYTALDTPGGTDPRTV